MANIWENTVITNSGIELQAKAMAGNGKIELTSAKVGSGSVPVEQLQIQTAVSGFKQNAEIGQLRRDGNTVIIPIRLLNEGVSTGYNLVQVGIYANDPDKGEILYAIGQCSKARYVPSVAETTAYSLEWNFHFTLSNDLEMTVNLNPAGYVTLYEFEEHINDYRKHIPMVPATSSDGITYTATVDGLTELYKGLRLVIIPSRVSADKTPKLNVNGLGEKSIIMPIGGVNNVITTNAAKLPTWLSADMPIEIRYDGTRWRSEIFSNSAQYLYGQVPVDSGGTGASTAGAALKNLGIMSASFTGESRFDEDSDYAGTPTTTVQLDTGVITKCPLTQAVFNGTGENNYDNTFFTIKNDGGITVNYDGYYLISGSVYITQVETQEIFAKSAYIKDSNGRELCSATEVLFNEDIPGCVSIAPKVLFLRDETTLYLYARSQKTSGTMYPGNLGTYLSIVKIGSN